MPHIPQRPTSAAQFSPHIPTTQPAPNAPAPQPTPSAPQLSPQENLDIQGNTASSQHAPSLVEFAAPEAQIAEEKPPVSPEVQHILNQIKLLFKQAPPSQLGELANSLGEIMKQLEAKIEKLGQPQAPSQTAPEQP